MDSLICNSNGICIQQTDSNNGCIKYDSISCTHSCKPIRCPNYIYCKKVTPQWVLSENEGVCLDCYSLFGNLRIVEDKQCSLCPKTTLSLQDPNTSQEVCISCYMREYYSYPVDAPEFPYSQKIRNRYDKNPVPLENDPLIQQYLQDYSDWKEDMIHSAFHNCLAQKSPEF